MASKLDDIDLQIVDSLQENPNLSHSEIAKKLGRSQPTISNRVKSLIKQNHYAAQFGVNFQNNRDISLIRIDARVNNPKTFLDRIQLCPLVLNCFKSSGEFNIFALIATTEIRGIQSVVDQLFLNSPEVQLFKTEFIDTIINKLVLPIDQIALSMANIKKYCDTCQKCRKYHSEPSLLPAGSPKSGLMVLK
jgi:DNA-binding Lrp family transcriptional regulator